MRFVAPACSILFFVAAFAARSETGAVPQPADAARHGVAYFEPPRSIGTPLDELARSYTGLALADRIAGRLRLDTDVTLHPAARDLIRRRLADRSY